MSPQNQWIRGQAVFGTWVGLDAFGNGILAGVRDTPGVFEFGRNRNDPLHQFEERQLAAFFCRRVTDEAQGREIELIGAVGPCKDAQGRRGFLGACVATDIDCRQPHYRFADWAALAEDIPSVFTKAAKSFDSAKWASLLRDHALEPARDDQVFHWAPTTSVVQGFHWDDDWDVAWDFGWDREALERMQAIAFMIGTQHPTVLVFKSKAAEAELASLRSKRCDDYLRGFQKAKSEGPKHRKADPAHSGRLYGNGVQITEAQTPDRFAKLEKRVRRLEDEVHVLQGIVQPSRDATPSAPPSSGAQQAASFPVLKVVIVVACGAVLLAGSILLGVFLSGLFGQSAS